MVIRTFDDIKAIDGELAGLFLRPDMAAGWVYAVEHGIKEWISRHNKQYWEIVRFVSERQGILGKLKKDHKCVWLKREDFARIVLKFCPNAVAKDESVSALKSSMEHCEFTNELRNLDWKPGEYQVERHIKAVEELLEGKPVVESVDVVKEPTLEDLLVTYLRREVDDQGNGFTCSKLLVRPQYEGISPAVAIETYKSEQFKKSHQPSHTEAYEIVDGVLEKSKFYELAGRYQDKRMKLFIVSSAGLLPDVRSLAMDRNIGYVLLNPNSAMTSDSYVLPRSIEDYTKWRHELDVLEGTRPMKSPLLIMDGSRLTSSLADVLKENGVAVKSNRLLDIPNLYKTDIEQHANALTASVVERMIIKFQLPTILNEDMCIDPFAFADLCGLSHDEEAMEDLFQLGYLDVEANRVILNSAGKVDLNRKRFTMAHELGHFLLHAPLLRKQGLMSVGESTKTQLFGENASRTIEYEANKFASYLLMPKKLVNVMFVYFYETYVTKLFGRRDYSVYYCLDQKETNQNYDNTVGRMARMLHVSKEAMEYRLKNLGLLKTP